jgi:hypothetical protein
VTTVLTESGYIQTKAKLADLIERRSRVTARTDLSALHSAEATASYDRMIGQYRREIELYDSTHARAPEAAME